MGLGFQPQTFYFLLRDFINSTNWIRFYFQLNNIIKIKRIFIYLSLASFIPLLVAPFQKISK